MSATISGRDVRRRIDQLDPVRDADEIARLSLVMLHGRGVLVYALFTVAFMKQVAVPTMARTLYRRGTGDIVRQTLQRNDDTIVFFGQLLDHGPGSPTGREWIERLNEIHANFPLRNNDSLYTLSTLALDPESITSSLGCALFTDAELEAQWRFWREVAVGQRIENIPEDRAELRRWSERYARDEYAPSEDGRAIADALISAFGQRYLPRSLRRWERDVISALCPSELRAIHALTEPAPAVRRAVRLLLQLYSKTVLWQRVPRNRSLADDFGTARYGVRSPKEVGYRGSTNRPG